MNSQTLSLSQVQELGLQKQYLEDLAFNEAVRCMSAMAFVPPQDVRQAFEKLKTNLPDEADPLVEYFERTGVGRWHIEGREEDTGEDRLSRVFRWKAPLFLPHIWSAYE